MYTWLEELLGVGTYANICHFTCNNISVNTNRHRQIYVSAREHSLNTVRSFRALQRCSFPVAVSASRCHAIYKGHMRPVGIGNARQQRQDTEMRRVRAHCTNCEICTGSRYLVCTLAYVGILFLSSSLYLSPPLSATPARRGESWRCSQMRALTSIIASNALGAGGQYTPFHTLVPLALCAHMWFPAFSINQVVLLEVRQRTFVCQRFVLDSNAVEQCACCCSLTNLRHHRHDSPTLPPTQKVFRFPTDEHV